MFDSQEYRQDRLQGLKKKKMNIKKLDLVAAQCNGIATCAYSLKNILIVWCLCNCTWSVALRPLFSFILDKRTSNIPVYGRLLKRPLLSSFWKMGPYFGHACYVCVDLFFFLVLSTSSSLNGG